MPRPDNDRTLITAGKNGEYLHNRNGIVIEHGRDIFGWKLVRCVTDEQARLANRTIPDNNASIFIKRRDGQPIVLGPPDGNTKRDALAASRAARSRSKVLWSLIGSQGSQHAHPWGFPWRINATGGTEPT
jgi:hypothetical protein